MDFHLSIAHYSLCFLPGVFETSLLSGKLDLAVSCVLAPGLLLYEHLNINLDN